MFHLRRLVTALLVLTLIIPAGASAATASQASQKARLVKAKGFGTVYMVAEGQKLRVPNKAVKKRGYKKSDIQVISSKDLKKIPVARYVQAEEGGKVYAVNVSGNRTAALDESQVVQVSSVTIVELPKDQLELFTEVTVLKNLSTNVALGVPGSIVELKHNRPWLGYTFQINNKGQVLNDLLIWDNGEPKVFADEFPQYIIQAHAMNNKGQVVGSVKLKDQDVDERPFLIDNGKFQLLGGMDFLGNAFDINDKGQIVGYQMGRGGSWQKAFLWEKGKITYLGTLAGGDNSSAYKINNNGQIIGHSNVAGEEASSHAYFWENGHMSEIGAHTLAIDINDKGQVIGNLQDPKTYKEINFLWENGVMKTIPISPIAINNKGQILGAYLLKKEDGHVDSWNVILDHEDVIDFRKLVKSPFTVTDLNGRTLEPDFVPMHLNDNGEIVGSIMAKPYVYTLPTTMQPQFSFTSPTGSPALDNDGTKETIKITWIDGDLNDDPMISFYTFFFPESGIVEDGIYRKNLVNIGIPLGTVHQDGANTFTIDLTQFPKGTLSPYAVIDDGVHPPQTIYLSGSAE